MDLILSEQVLLIALDEGNGRDTAGSAGDAGLAAGLLLDLASRDLVRAEDDDKIIAVEGGDPGHELLREAYAAILGSGKPHSAKGWVDRLPRVLRPLRDRLARGLVERGVLTEKHSLVLGIFATTRFPEADAGPERELRDRLGEVLIGGRKPTEEEALLVGLLEPLGLIDAVVPGDRRRAARKRAKEVAAPSVASTAVRDAVRAVQTAVITAAIVPAVTAAIST
jgi:hypothetical protein